MATAEQEHLASQIRLEVVRAYQQYVSARERLAVAGQVIDQATETHRIIQNRYREGLTTITEVLRAETALVRSRLNLVAARYDHYVSYAHVLLSVGKMTDIQPFLIRAGQSVTNGMDLLRVRYGPCTLSNRTEESMRRKWIVISMIFLAVMIISCGKKEEAVVEKPTTLQGVKMETIKLSPVEEEYEAVGTVRSKTTSRPFFQDSGQYPGCPCP